MVSVFPRWNSGGCVNFENTRCGSGTYLLASKRCCKNQSLQDSNPAGRFKARRLNHYTTGLQGKYHYVHCFPPPFIRSPSHQSRSLRADGLERCLGLAFGDLVHANALGRVALENAVSDRGQVPPVVLFRVQSQALDLHPSQIESCSPLQ